MRKPANEPDSQRPEEKLSKAAVSRMDLSTVESHLERLYGDLQSLEHDLFVAEQDMGDGFAAAWAGEGESSDGLAGIDWGIPYYGDEEPGDGEGAVDDELLPMTPGQCHLKIDAVQRQIDLLEERELSLLKKSGPHNKKPFRLRQLEHDFPGIAVAYDRVYREGNRRAIERFEFEPTREERVREEDVNSCIAQMREIYARCAAAGLRFK